MGSFLMFGSAALFWALSFEAVSSNQAWLFVFLPVAVVLSAATLRTTMGRMSGGGLISGLWGTVLNLARSADRPSALQILAIGEDFVEFAHPEGGSWSYGLAEDLRAVNGVEVLQSLGNSRYRIWVRRNPVHAAQVLHAAYRFRTEPKAMRGGAIDLNECPGFDILTREALYDLD